MEQSKIDIIKNQSSNLKNIPNSKLVEFMDYLTVEFETKKTSIIDLTLQLDNIELLYNTVLKEFQNRNAK